MLAPDAGHSGHQRSVGHEAVAKALHALSTNKQKRNKDFFVARILINAANMIGSGGRAVGLSLLPSLIRSMPKISFSLLLPDEPQFRSLEFPISTNTRFIKRTLGFRNELFRLKEVFWAVPQIARREKAQLCLTLGDIGPIYMPCPQIIFLHQPLLVYEEQELAGLRGWSPLKHFYLTKHFAWTSHQAAYIVVQTPIMAQRLIKKYRVDPQKVVIIPQPVPQHITVENKKETLHPQIVMCNKPIKLLFLASYNRHKNHAILPLLAKELRRRGMADKVHIFLTLRKSNTKSSKIRLELAHFPDIITNLGRLAMTEVAGALRASSALFLPTLVESYGLTYIESLSCGVPILTSNRDFAHWICRDLALYFDPLDVTSIVDAIEELPSLTKDATYPHAATQHLSTFPKGWNEVAKMFVAVLE